MTQRLVEAAIEADRGCREAVGRGLCSGSDYAAHAPSGAPNLQWIYRHFGKPRRVLAEIGLLALAHPEARLLLQYAPGRNGNVKKGQDRYSPAEKDRAAAVVMDESGSLQPTRDQLEDVRQRLDGQIPGYDAIRTRGHETLPWPEIWKRGLGVVLAHPEVFPRATRLHAGRNTPGRGV